MATCFSLIAPRISSYHVASHCYPFLRRRNLRSFPCLSVRCYQNAFHWHFEFLLLERVRLCPVLRAPDNMQYDSQDFMLFWILRFQVHCLYTNAVFAPWLCSWNVGVNQKWYSCQKLWVGVIRVQPAAKPKMRERKLRNVVNWQGALKQKRCKTRPTYIYTLSPRVQYTHTSLHQPYC